MTDRREGPERFLLEKRGLYYRPNSAGYCGAKVQAGRFTEAEVAIYRAHPGDGVSIIPEAEAAEFAPSCWPEVKVDVLTAALAAAEAERDALRGEVEAAYLKGFDGGFLWGSNRLPESGEFTELARERFRNEFPEYADDEVFRLHRAARCQGSDDRFPDR